MRWAHPVPLCFKEAWVIGSNDVGTRRRVVCANSSKYKTVKRKTKTPVQANNSPLALLGGTETPEMTQC